MITKICHSLQYGFSTSYAWYNGLIFRVTAHYGRPVYPVVVEQEIFSGYSLIMLEFLREFIPPENRRRPKCTEP
jgi:hypothetical protein